LSSAADHVTTCYPLARKVGCSCGWERTNVDESIMDELCLIHLQDRGVIV